jgi:outer membrane autotransporter protein
MFPLNNQWGLFGKVGYDYMSIASTNAVILETNSVSTDAFNASGVLLAAGASYDIKPNLALTLAYNQLLDSATKNGTNQKINVSYGTVGLTYLF